MRVVFLGAPGVGKGTQADRIASRFKIVKISTGDLLRAAVRDQTRLGREAKSFMDQGRLVPDSVVIGLVRDKLADPNIASGFVLDGFPRTIAQAQELDQVLASASAPLDRVVNFQVPREEIIKRLSGRRSCPKCQATFHTDFAPSRTEAACDRCGESLVQRNDDRREAVETRLKVYDEQTAPLIRHYGDQGLLSELDGSGAVDAVSERLSGIVAPYKGT